MPLTPLDIHNKEFTKGFRGYSEREVDEFLDTVVRDYDAILKENATLKEQIDALTGKLDQYRRLEDTLQSTLVVAQETADELRSNARREADVIVREAQAEADSMLRTGEERAQELTRRLAQLQDEMRAFRARLRGLLVAQLDLLDADWGIPQAAPLPARGVPITGVRDGGVPDRGGAGAPEAEVEGAGAPDAGWETAGGRDDPEGDAD